MVLRGVRLEAVRIGGAWHTTREAFGRFCERLTAMEGGEEVTTSNAPSEQLTRELEDTGW